MEITIVLVSVLLLIAAVWGVMEIQARGETYGMEMFSSLQFVLMAVGSIFTFIYLINAGQYVVVDQEGYTRVLGEISSSAEKLTMFEEQADWNKYPPVAAKHRQSGQKKEDSTLEVAKEIFNESASFQSFEEELSRRGLTLGTTGDRYNSLLGKICYLIFFGVSLFLNIRQSTFGFGLSYTLTQALLCAIAIIVVVLIILAALSKDGKRGRRRR